MRALVEDITRMTTEVVGPSWGFALVAVILVAVFSGVAGQTGLYLETLPVFGGSRQLPKDATNGHEQHDPLRDV